VVPIAGKQVPITPDWLNKFIASTTWGNFEAQLSGDYVGRRYATYLNDIAIPGQFQLGLEASYAFDDVGVDWIKKFRISGNITNLTDTTGVADINVPGSPASGGYSYYPLPPRMFFVTVAGNL
jgi:outer membrane receptor protein involved in Fe transport